MLTSKNHVSTDRGQPILFSWCVLFIYFCIDDFPVLISFPVAFIYQYVLFLRRIAMKLTPTKSCDYSSANVFQVVSTIAQAQTCQLDDDVIKKAG